MKKVECTESLNVTTIKKLEVGMIVKNIALEIVNSIAMFYIRKAKYGGMEASAVERLKDLETEHAELKKKFAELCIEIRSKINLMEKSCNAIGEKGSC